MAITGKESEMKTIQIIVKILGGLAVSLGINIAAHAGTQGVSDAQIVLGSHQPLSGPLAGWGVPTTNGMRMRVEEIYSAGEEILIISPLHHQDHLHR